MSSGRTPLRGADNEAMAGQDVWAYKLYKYLTIMLAFRILYQQKHAKKRVFIAWLRQLIL